MKCTCFFRHALALHERRVRFLPEYVHGGQGPFAHEAPAPFPVGLSDASPNPTIYPPNASGASQTASTAAPIGPSNDTPDPAPVSAAEEPFDSPIGPSLTVHTPHTKEVWFPGSHSDIGGGTHRNLKMQRFAPALRWMSFEAIAAGLKLDAAPQDWSAVTKTSDSLSRAWKIAEHVPLTHRSYQVKPVTWWRRHRGQPRTIQRGQLVHESALLDTSAFRKTNTAQFAPTLAPLSWGLPPHDLQELCGELDPYTNARTFMEDRSDIDDIRSLSEIQPDTATRLKELISTEPGRRAMRDAGAQFPGHNDAPSRRLNSLFELCINAEIASLENETTAQLVKATPNMLRTIDSPTNLTLRFRPAFDHLIPLLATFNARDRAVFKTFLSSLPCAPPLSLPSGDIPWIAYVPQKAAILCLLRNESPTSGVHAWEANSPAAIRHITGSLSPQGTEVTLETTVVCAVLLSTREPKTLLTVTHPARFQEWTLDRAEMHGSAVSINPRPGDTQFRKLDHPADRPESDWNDVWVRCIAVSSDEKLLATAWWDRTVVIYQLSSFTPLMILRDTHHGTVASVAFSPDSQQLLTASWDNTLSIWAVKDEVTSNVDTAVVHASATPIRTIIEHTNDVNYATYSPSGDLIASASDDCTVIVWKADTGEPLHLRGHEAAVLCVAFSPDSERVVSGSYDGTVRLWDTKTGAQIGLFHHGEFVTAVAFSHDGHQFISAGDGKVLVWDEWSDISVSHAIEKAEGARSMRSRSRSVLNVM